MTSIDQCIAEVRRIAPQMLTGIDDPRAAEKLANEQAELAQKLALGDRVGVLTELADVTYFTFKALINGFMTREEAEETMRFTCDQCGVDLSTALRAMQAKYECRIASGKRDDLERAAVAAACAKEDPGEAPTAQQSGGFCCKRDGPMGTLRG